MVPGCRNQRDVPAGSGTDRPTTGGASGEMRGWPRITSDGAVAVSTVTDASGSRTVSAPRVTSSTGDCAMTDAGTSVVQPHGSRPLSANSAWVVSASAVALPESRGRDPPGHVSRTDAFTGARTLTRTGSSGGRSIGPRGCTLAVSTTSVPLSD